MAWSLGLLELGAVGAGSDCLVPSGLGGPAAFGMLAFWLQKGQVPAADSRRLERGMVAFPVGS